MHKLLGDLFQKMNIKPQDLTEEEKKTYDKWNSILEEEVTVEKIAEFCRRQQGLVEKKWQDKYRDRTNDPFLADIHSVYGLIVTMIESDRTERASLEQHIEKLLDTSHENTL